MFCGESCRENALNSFHRIECQVLPLVFSSLKLGKIELLALRILIIASKQGKELANLFEHPLYQRPFAEKYSDFKNKYSSDDYFSVHNLEDNYAKRSVNDLFQRSMAAAVLLHILKQSSFFEDIYKEADRVRRNKLKFVLFSSISFANRRAAFLMSLIATYVFLNAPIFHNL